MVRRIIFDLDDTLVHTGRTFRNQLKTFAEKVHERFEGVGSPDEVLSEQQRIDRELLNDGELALKHFPESLARTWEYFCREHGSSVRETDVEECRQIGWDVYEMIPEPLNGLESVLGSLQDDYELVLYTMGSPKVQYRKIDSFNLQHWFSTLHITPKKTVDVLDRIIKPYPPEQVMIVGDSLRTEIQHGLELGMNVLHRDPGDIWHFHDVDIDEDFPRVEELKDVLDHVP